MTTKYTFECSNTISEPEAELALKQQNKTHKKIKTKENWEFVFKKTSFGMPIMYRVYN